MKRLPLFLFFLVVTCHLAKAQGNTVISIETGKTQMVLYVQKDLELSFVHYGLKTGSGYKS